MALRTWRPISPTIINHTLVDLRKSKRKWIEEQIEDDANLFAEDRPISQDLYKNSAD